MVGIIAVLILVVVVHPVKTLLVHFQKSVLARIAQSVITKWGQYQCMHVINVNSGGTANFELDRPWA